MKLATHGLEIELVPLGPADGEGWGRVSVSLRVPGFDGNTEASLQTDDVSRFLAELKALGEAVGKVGTATLASAEPELEIIFTMERLGGISGRYRIEGHRLGDVPTVLSGAFVADQSFLHGLVRDAQALLFALEARHEA